MKTYNSYLICTFYDELGGGMPPERAPRPSVGDTSHRGLHLTASDVGSRSAGRFRFRRRGPVSRTVSFEQRVPPERGRIDTVDFSVSEDGRAGFSGTESKTVMGDGGPPGNDHGRSGVRLDATDLVGRRSMTSHGHLQRTRRSTGDGEAPETEKHRRRGSTRDGEAPETGKHPRRRSTGDGKYRTDFS
jgi:hypothetical protein